MKSSLSLLALALLSFNSFAGTENNIQSCRLEKRSDKIHLLKGSESVYWSRNPIEAILKLDTYAKLGLCSAPKESCAIVKVSDTGEEAIFINKNVLIKGKGAEESLILFQKVKICVQNGVLVGDYNVEDKEVRNLSVRFTKEEAKKKFNIVN